MLQEIEFHIRGIAPLLMHNGQMADPLNSFAKALKEVSGKRKKTDEDHAEMSKIEWHASLYVNNDGMLILPAHILEAAIHEGAKKQKLGKQFKSAVFVESDSLLNIGIDKKASELWGMSRYRDVRGVKVSQARIMRTRPIFSQWESVFTVTFDDGQVNAADVKRAVADTGSIVGLCDYRPKFGRFELLAS